jgi:hypothetical protein
MSSYLISRSISPRRDLLDRVRISHLEATEPSGRPASWAVYSFPGNQSIPASLSAPVRPQWQTEKGVPSTSHGTVLCHEQTWVFASKSGLLRAIHDYVGLLETHFRVQGIPYCRHVQDPETNDQYIYVEVDVSGTDDQILQSEDQFRRALIRRFRPDELYPLRLAYNAM